MTEPDFRLEAAVACLVWLQSGYKRHKDTVFSQSVSFPSCCRSTNAPFLRHILAALSNAAHWQLEISSALLNDLDLDPCQWQGAPVSSTTSRLALGPKQPPVQWVGHFRWEQSGRNVTLSCHLRLRLTAAVLLCRSVRGMDRDGCTFRLYRRLVCSGLGNAAVRCCRGAMWRSGAVFLNRRAAAQYRSLGSIIPGHERFSWNLLF